MLTGEWSDLALLSQFGFWLSYALHKSIYLTPELVMTDTRVSEDVVYMYAAVLFEKLMCSTKRRERSSAGRTLSPGL